MRTNGGIAKRPIIKAFASCSEEVKCTICGGFVAQRHRGVVACNACAAFFRRSLTLRKTYTCKFQRHCKLSGDSSKPMCKQCRLQKCFEVGMICEKGKRAITTISCEDFHNSVVSIPRGSPEEPLGKLTSCWKSRVYNRAAYMKTLLAPLYANVDPKDLRNNADLGLAECVVVEPHVLRLFAQGTGLLDALPDVKAKDLFIQNCMFPWGLHEMVINTVRNKGHLTNTIHTTFEDSIIPNSRETAVEFYKEHGVKNVDVAVEALMERSETFLNTCRLFVKLRFNDAEQAVLAQIGLLKCAAELFGRERRQTLLNDLFRQFYEYHSQSSANFAVRLGDLMLFLQDFEQTYNMWEQFRILLCTFSCNEPHPDSPQPVRDYASLLHQQWRLYDAGLEVNVTD